MSEKAEVAPVEMPVCPYCKVSMRPLYFKGDYDEFPMWECDCERIPGAEDEYGVYL